MPQTYSQMLFHLIFATKDREPLLQIPIQQPLYDRLRELTQEEGGRLLEAGGMPDHVHLLVQGRPTLSIAAMVQRLKGSTSHWLSERGVKARGEALWQRGYGVFTVSESNRDRIRRYIQNQPEHHRKLSSREEFLLLLEKHRIPIDPYHLDHEE